MNTLWRGNAAEAAVMSALVGRGYRVLVPFGDGHPYDLAVDADGVLVRVQCKSGWRRGGCVIFNSRSTDHGAGPRPYTGRADVFGVYYRETETVYAVPVTDVAAHEGRLRIEPALNNQTRGTRLAADYELDRWFPSALAA